MNAELTIGLLSIAGWLVENVFIAAMLLASTSGIMLVRRLTAGSSNFLSSVSPRGLDDGILDDAIYEVFCRIGIGLGLYTPLFGFIEV